MNPAPRLLQPSPADSTAQLKGNRLLCQGTDTSVCPFKNAVYMFASISIDILLLLPYNYLLIDKIKRDKERIMKKIFSILGDYYHSHDLALEALEKALASIDSRTVPEDIGVGKLSEALDENPALIILGKMNKLNPAEENPVNWMTPELEKRITDYVSGGGGFIAWHSGLSGFPEDGPLVRMLGGVFIRHPKENQVIAYSAVEPIFITDRPYSFEVPDEHYFVKCDTERTNVFLTSESADGKCEAGWAHEYGAGRVLCITPTHRAEGFTNAEMIRLLADSIKWCLKL